MGSRRPQRVWRAAWKDHTGPRTEGRMGGDFEAQIDLVRTFARAFPGVCGPGRHTPSYHYCEFDFSMSSNAIFPAPSDADFVSVSYPLPIHVLSS